MTKRKMKVLVVDDSPHIRSIVSLILAKKGYEIIEAENGRDALSKLNENLVALIITDMKMPEMDGIEFLRRLQSVDSYKLTPVIGLTAEFIAYENKVTGVCEWVTKPFIPKQLLEAVRKFTVSKNNITQDKEVCYGTGKSN